MHIKQY